MPDLLALRQFLIGQWPHGESRGQCIRTSLFLQGLLGGELQAGWPHEDGRRLDAGFLSGQGWQFHYWLLLEGRIVDLTADQFGAETVIFSCDDPRYKHVASPQQLHQDSRDAAQTARRWIEAYKTRVV